MILISLGEILEASNRLTLQSGTLHYAVLFEDVP
jgi:hypothetical protein